MYHRIADADVDPWDLAVSPKNFAAHLSVLRRNRFPMAVDALVDDFRNHRIRDNAVAVTFDDGYEDNLSTAKPLLDRAEIPATVFLATGFIDQASGFWWDELAEILLVGIADDHLPPGPLGATAIPIGRRDPRLVSRHWRFAGGPRTDRQHHTIEIWKAVRSKNATSRDDAMQWLRDLTSDQMDNVGRPMSGAEIQELLSGGLVSLGAHTKTHRALSSLGRTEIEEELTESLQRCTQLSGRRVAGLSYPFGAYDGRVKKAAAQCGFDYAIGMHESPIFPGAGAYSMPRAHVRNMDGSSFERYLTAIAG
jgi:peptidoglycan/xylan/chitin deacetylase (PgdA/CDA1 family)